MDEEENEVLEELLDVKDRLKFGALFFVIVVIVAVTGAVIMSSCSDCNDRFGFWGDNGCDDCGDGYYNESSVIGYDRFVGALYERQNKRY